ncbi:hypothetical protein HZI73_16775 [Vallitalea pronyensis]|uniref:Phosphoribosyltransferase domain-containing protein n=1 Tax=Vallitalea pronyensis TaxID=1348613 RepID=A0A8J8SHR9_9FIRM|nr:phosphoribosyltransferase family protein [Vallitalea pronyensis]QUI23846.1 hypothetical protein HZI73_16775 [Vallitalea pronyensis]
MAINDIIFNIDPSKDLEIIRWNDFQKDIDLLANKIQTNFEPDVIVGIFQGGWVVAQVLADYFIKSNIAGIRAVKDKNILMPEVMFTDETLHEIKDLLNGAKVLLVDEVIDSGKTASFFLGKLYEYSSQCVKTACTHVYIDSVVKPDFFIHEFTSYKNFIFPWRINRDASCMVNYILRETDADLYEILANIRKVFNVNVQERAVINALKKLENSMVVENHQGIWRRII